MKSNVEVNRIDENLPINYHKMRCTTGMYSLVGFPNTIFISDVGNNTVYRYNKERSVLDAWRGSDFPTWLDTSPTFIRLPVGTRIDISFIQD